MSFIMPNNSALYFRNSRSGDIQENQLLNTLSIIDTNLTKAGFRKDEIGALKISFLFRLKATVEAEILGNYNGGFSNSDCAAALYEAGIPFYKVMKTLTKSQEFEDGMEYLFQNIKADPQNQLQNSPPPVNFTLEPDNNNNNSYKVYPTEEAAYLSEIAEQLKGVTKGGSNSKLMQISSEFNDSKFKEMAYRFWLYRFKLNDDVLYSEYKKYLANFANNNNPRSKIQKEPQEEGQFIKTYLEGAVEKKVGYEEFLTDSSVYAYMNLLRLLLDLNFDGLDLSGGTKQFFDTSNKPVIEMWEDYLFLVFGEPSSRIKKMGYQNAGADYFRGKWIDLSNHFKICLAKSILFPVTSYINCGVASTNAAPLMKPWVNAPLSFYEQYFPFFSGEYLQLKSENSTILSDNLVNYYKKIYMAIKAFEKIISKIGSEDGSYFSIKTPVADLIRGNLQATMTRLIKEREKIVERLSKSDKNALKNIRKKYYFDDDNYDTDARYFSDAGSLTSDFESLRDKYKNNLAEFDKDIYNLNYDEDSEYKSKFSRSIISIYYKILFGYFSETVDFLKEYKTYRDNNNNFFDVKNRDDIYTKLRELKIKYNSKVFNVFKKLISTKHKSETNLEGFLKSLNVNVDGKQFYEAYDEYIKSILKLKNGDNLSDLISKCNLIGKGVGNMWGKYDMDDTLTQKVTSKSALLKLNSVIYSIVEQLKKAKDSPIFGNPYEELLKKIKECAIKDIMTIETIKTLIRPMNNVLNFDFLQGHTIENVKKRVKINLDFMKEDKIAGEKLLDFINSYTKVDVGNTTYYNHINLTNSFFFNSKDTKLKSAVSSLQKYMEVYDKFIKERGEQLVGKDSKEDEDTEASTDDETDVEEEKKEEPKAPVEKEIVEKLNSEGYVVPLMFHNNASMTSCDCEYQIMPNNQGVQIKLLNCPDVNTRPIIAVPIVNNSTMAPVTLNAGVGTIPNMSVGSNTQIHFYYEAMDADKFIGASRIHGLKDLKDAKELSINYADKNLDNDKEKTAISDYGDKIIVQLPKSFYPKNVVFVTCNEANKPDPDKYKHNVVCTKDGRYLLIIEDADLLKSLGNKFELHMYTNNISSGTYVTKLMIDRDSASSSEGKDASKLDEKDVESKDKKVFAEDADVEEEDGEKSKSSKKSKKSNKKGKKKDKEKEVDLDKDDEKNGEDKKAKSVEQQKYILNYLSDDDDDIDDDDDSWSFDD